MDELTGRGIQVLIPPDGAARRGSRPGWNSGRYAFMRRVLESEIAGELYRKRQVMVEPVFADTKFNRRIDRLLRRGRSAARSEWRPSRLARACALSLARRETIAYGGRPGAT